MGCPDQRGRENIHLGIRCDPAQVPLGGQVGRDHGHRLRQQGDTGREALPQAGAQLVPERDEADHRHRDRSEHRQEGGGEVAGYRARSR